MGVSGSCQMENRFWIRIAGFIRNLIQSLVSEVYFPVVSGWARYRSLRGL